MRIPRAKIREYAFREYRTFNGNTLRLTNGLQITARWIVDEEFPVASRPVGSALAIILLVLQIIQVLTWLYSYWHHNPPSEVPDNAEVVAAAKAGYAYHEDCFVPSPA